MRVLVVNAGSSSLRLRLLDADDAVVDDFHLESWDGADDSAAAAWLRELDAVDAVGHRVVHGGSALRKATPVDDDVVARIEELTPLAPLHQPRALAGLRMTRELLPRTPSVACFDTAYHATLPAAAATYALPAPWRSRWELRRYGFHGLSHAYAARRAATLLAPRVASRIVTCHLGAGASLCASVDGRSIDTTMGFTPLEGLVMASRSGSVDPGLLMWLVREGGLSVDEVADGLEHRAGLTGLTDGSGDMRDVLAARSDGDRRAGLAFDVYFHRLVGEIARMAASMGGLDVVVFTGGVGEHTPEVRAAVAERLDFLGVRIDADANADASDDADLSASDAPVASLVVTAREDLEIARQVREEIGSSA
jgi:acetate kinase